MKDTTELNKKIDLFMADFEEHESDRQNIINDLTVKGHEPKKYHESIELLMGVLQQIAGMEEVEGDGMFLFNYTLTPAQITISQADGAPIAEGYHGGTLEQMIHVCIGHFLNEYDKSAEKIRADFRHDFNIINPKEMVKFVDKLRDGELYALDLRDGTEFLLDEDHDHLGIINSGDFWFGTEKGGVEQ